MVTKRQLQQERLRTFILRENEKQARVAEQRQLRLQRAAVRESQRPLKELQRSQKGTKAFLKARRPTFVGELARERLQQEIAYARQPQQLKVLRQRLRAEKFRATGLGRVATGARSGLGQLFGSFRAGALSARSQQLAALRYQRKLSKLRQYRGTSPRSFQQIPEQQIPESKLYPEMNIPRKPLRELTAREAMAEALEAAKRDHIRARRFVDVV